MLLTFTINSSPKIPTLTSASGFYAHFWLSFVLWASMLALFLKSLTSTSGFDSNLGEILNLSFKVFDCFGRRSLALTSALGFSARFGRRHQHWLVGEVPAQLAGTCTGRRRAPEQGADGQPPTAALPGQLCSQ